MRTIKIIGTVFSIVGVGMLIAATLMATHTRGFAEGAERAEGEVIQLVRQRSSDSVTYAPVISFIAGNGLVYEFKSSLSSNPPAYEPGDRVAVLYNPERPLDARLDGFFSLWGGALVLGILGAVFGAGGAGMLAVPWYRRRRAKRLRAEGRRIEAAFHGVERNLSLRVNGRHPFFVVGQWQDPSTADVYVFRSDNIWYDPTDFINSASVPVYIDPADPRTYFMDLSFLPRSA